MASRQRLVLPFSLCPTLGTHRVLIPSIDCRCTVVDGPRLSFSLIIIRSYLMSLGLRRSGAYYSHWASDNLHIFTRLWERERTGANTAIPSDSNVFLLVL
ncbi:uncharacterized protein C8Q71DRAFT_149253 [Rhodofomes roseus]|uniref:Uncharacterized protein n=1 Tax=Rhodofomes roseus TaxID=34475 RepID=A0ABQ8KBG2_9APHY|nr:uncharacterized protein C8Q71DRAFT_149253 [Rhodofomes roseus]KAH9834602.1 hypothetical protein C8Q71DRAFT_149253 [Rhodofomes roseus]